MQIVNPGWDVAGSHVSASFLERTSAMAARGLSRMCHLPQDLLVLLHSVLVSSLLKIALMQVDESPAAEY